MKIVLYTVIVSPHQLPLARELAKCVGHDDFRYIYSRDVDDQRVRMGWDTTAAESWCRKVLPNDTDLENCEILLSGIRDLALFERRANRKLRTYYMSERWFKPIAGFLPGWLRLLYPSFLRMAVRLRHVMRESDEFRYFAIGKWAKRDMRLICGRQSENKMLPWGYFVTPSIVNPIARSSDSCRFLWVGRMLGWKRVDTIVLAMRKLSGVALPLPISMTLVGGGEQLCKLKKLAVGLPIQFIPSMPIDAIRAVMREHDVYILASNQREGWGAVTNEALEEGLYVLGTHDAGASSAILSPDALFRSGDVDGLVLKMLGCVQRKAQGLLVGQGIGEWSVAAAARRLLLM